LFMKPPGENSWHSRFIFIEITYQGIYSIVIFACILRLSSRIYKTRQKWIFHSEKMCSFSVYIYIYMYVFVCVCVCQIPHMHSSRYVCKHVNMWTLNYCTI
jgi:hypothetical protein